MALKRMQNDDAAQVGIGTMIVFIATILVAAVAAGVLIDTSQKLQAKSTQTGDAATQDVGTSLTVVSASGSRDAASTATLQQLDFFVTLAPGAEPVDLDNMIVQLNDGTNLRVAEYESAALTALTEFNVTFIRDSDSSGTNNVMTAGDLVQIRMGDNDGTPTLALGNNVKVAVNLVPATGHEVSFSFTTPATYGTATEVSLF